MDVRRLGLVGVTASLVAGAALLVVPSERADAIPPFARKYETSCASCHQGHYPRLNEFGRRFRENGYQLPDGAEAWAVAARSLESGAASERLAVFREVPLSVRGQIFGVVPANPGDAPNLSPSVYSMINGGGAVSKDVSFYFTWTPFPDPALHQMKVGFHNLFADTIGQGTLNIRAGRLFLLDFQRPSHRFLSPGATAVSNVSVGSNAFTFAEASDGVQIYGRPGWGPFHYELGLYAGDVADGAEQDDWKDVFGRTTYSFFQNTDHQLTVGAFGYLGRSEFETELGDVLLAQRDDFWIAGGEAEVDVGPVNLFGMAYASRHSDPANDGEPVSLGAYRAEAVCFFTPRLTGSVRFDVVTSTDDPSLGRLELAPHLTYATAGNVLTTVAWRQDLEDGAASSLVGSVDVTF